MMPTETKPLPLESSAAPNARRGLLIAAGLLAAATGVGLSLRQSKPSGNESPGEPFVGFWSLQWDSPQGQPVRLQAFRGRPLLINFWATWCPPCIEELPLINAFYDENKAKSWQVLGLAVDKPSAVHAFLQKTPLHFPIGMAGLSGTDLAIQLGNPSGSLPFSVAIGKQGEVLQRKLGRLQRQDLDDWAQLK